MSRAKVKVIKKTSQDPEITEIFSNMMEGGMKLEIIHKKYLKMKEHCERYYKLFCKITSIKSNI